MKIDPGRVNSGEMQAASPPFDACFTASYELAASKLCKTFHGGGMPARGYALLSLCFAIDCRKPNNGIRIAVGELICAHVGSRVTQPSQPRTQI
jgi:hypothetical protein